MSLLDRQNATLMDAKIEDDPDIKELRSQMEDGLNVSAPYRYLT
jgi:hypothetical protein